MSAATDATGLLHLLAAEPGLLPAAPVNATGTDIDRRCKDEVHTCLRCGHRAQAALIATTPRAGKRWLDLCMPCLIAVRQAAETDSKWGA